MKEIQKFAFQNCTSLTEITIPRTVTTLGANLFVGCTNLHKITFQGEVPAVTGNTLLNLTAQIVYSPYLSGWDSVKNNAVWAAAAKLTWTADKNGVIAQGTCGYNEDVEWSIQGNTLYLTGYAIQTESEKTVPWSSYKKSIQKVVVEEGTGILGYRIFNGLSAVTEDKPSCQLAEY